MAEPTNTPMPPSTPIDSVTPRSGSPTSGNFPSANGVFSNPNLARLANMSLSPVQPFGQVLIPEEKPVVLHIGDPIKYNPHTYADFSNRFHVIRPSAQERNRDEFVKALKEGRWGDFDAIFRPFWGTGGEMGKWDDELISLLPPSVKVFASAGAGFDWADVRALGERGIIYCNSGLAAAEAVADFAVAMIISTFRHLPWCISAATSRDAAQFESCHTRVTMSSHLLRGHALGLIGLGNIGQQIAYKCRAAFGLHIHYYDVERKPASVEHQLGASYYDTLASLLNASDCVVLATPAMSGGKALINTRTLAAFRRGARFVNVARGSLVDEEALADALSDGQLSAVALDVHAAEPGINPRLAAFAEQGRAMLTCHNAGGTVETHAGFEELSMRNIMNVLGGAGPITPVNLQWLRK